MQQAVKGVQHERMRKFVLEFRPNGLLAMTAIKPGKPTSTRTFEMPDEADQLTRWAIEHNEAGCNVYYTPNPVKCKITRKASVKDIAQVDFVFTDIDPDTSDGYEQGREKLLARVDGDLMNGDHAPTWIIDSGNGVNVLYRVSESLIDKDKGKHLNQGLVAMFGGDGSAVDVSRILRMPFTKNYPSKAKLTKGYPETPSTSSVLHGKRGTTYTVEAFDTWFQSSGSSPPAKANSEQHSENLAIEQPDLDVTLADVEEALSKLDPGMPEAEWKGVGMIMCHQGQGDVAWLSAWDAWSRGGHNYQDRHDLESRWKSWKKNNRTPGKRVKVGTLLKMVREVDPDFHWPSDLDFPESESTSTWPTAAELGFTDCLNYTRTDDVGRILSPADALSDHPSPPLIDDIIKLHEVTFIYGDPKAGKTTFWIEMERRISRGEDFGKHYVEKGAVLHYTFEGSKPAKKKQDDIREINRRGIPLRAICFDTLAAAAGQVDENSVKDMQPTLKLLPSLAARYPMAIIVVHHSPKNGSGPRGSGAIRGMYDTGLEVSKIKGGHLKGGHQMKVVDQRDSDSEDMKCPFSIVGVEGFHRHPKTGKMEMAGLYSRESTNDQTIPLNHEAEKLHEALQAVSKEYDVELLENKHVQEAKENWAKAIDVSDKESIRKKWAAARKELEVKHVWRFIKQSGNGIWKACLKGSFDDPGEDEFEEAS